MIMEVKWQHGKTLEQNNMEIAKLAMKLALGDKPRAAASLDISMETLNSLLDQAAADQKIQVNAQARYDAQRKLANARLRAPVASHQHVEWNDDKLETPQDMGLEAVGSTQFAPRTESGMSNSLGVQARKPASTTPAKSASTKPAPAATKPSAPLTMASASSAKSALPKAPAKKTKATSKQKGA